MLIGLSIKLGLMPLVEKKESSLTWHGFVHITFFSSLTKDFQFCQSNDRAFFGIAEQLF